LVKEIHSKLRPFDYDPAPRPDGMVLTKKPKMILENGAEYEGQWN